MTHHAPFIVFEGIDGSGKGTQIRRFASFLETESITHIALAEPTNGSYGREIRRILGSGMHPSPAEMVKLFILDREDDVNCNIMPALESGTLVLMDRYYYSNAAYQGAMGLDWQMILEQNTSRKFPRPDRVYLLDLLPSVAIERIEKRGGPSRDIFEKLGFLEKVRENYKAMNDSGFLTVDASRDEDSIAAIISDDFTEHFLRR